MKRKLLKWTTALAALLGVSCSSELAFEGGAYGNGVEDEEVDVTFSISAEGLTTRASRAGGVGSQTVGRASEIDMLVYAVYDEKYKLLHQYSKGIDETLKDAPAVAVNITKTDENKLHDGQSIIKATADDGSSILDAGGLNLTFRLVRNKTFHIVFWAQSSKTNAYDTNDLENIKVNYREATTADYDATETSDATEGAMPNNDEQRDAFCKVESFSVSTSGSTRKVVLTRPLAQINLGTTGADYKYLLYGANVAPNKKITQSKIFLSGVAETFDAVKDKIGEATEKTIVFDYHTIPAFINMEEIPTDKAELLGHNPSETNPTTEEFLKVDLDQNGIFTNYKTSFPTLNSKGNPLTETFKYLSMCYVLVPATKIVETDWGHDADPKTDDDGNQLPEEPVESEDKDVTVPKYTSSVLNSVQIHFAETADDGTATGGYMAINLKEVPVHRNYRTNIIGGVGYYSEPSYDPEDPTDPVPDPDPDEPKDPDPAPDGPPSFDDPDEPTSSVFRYTKAKIIIDRDYIDDHNRIEQGNTFVDPDELPSKDDSDKEEEDIEEEQSDSGNPNGGED